MRALHVHRTTPASSCTSRRTASSAPRPRRRLPNLSVGRRGRAIGVLRHRGAVHDAAPGLGNTANPTRRATPTPASTCTTGTCSRSPAMDPVQRPRRVRQGRRRRGRRDACGSASSCRRTSPGFQKGFFDRYMDPTEINGRFDDARRSSFPDIAEIVPLPNLTAGLPAQGVRPSIGPSNFTTPARPATSSATRHAGRDPRVARDGPPGRQPAHGPVREPGRPGARRSRCTMNGMDLTVSLATNAAGALSSTAAQIVAAINANPAASALADARSPTAATRAPASSQPRRRASAAVATS